MLVASTTISVRPKRLITDRSWDSLQASHSMDFTWLLLMFTQTAVTLCNCHYRCSVKYPAKNRALEMHTYEEKTTRSHVTCGRDCFEQSDCASFNFLASTRLCQLNNVSRLQYPNHLVDRHGSFYFDDAEDTPRFSVEHFRSCESLLDSGYQTSGEYTIYPNGFENGLSVYCDMETGGGGWAVIQRRKDGSVDFYRDWATYRSGFGNLSGEFWIGNDILLNLTKFSGWWRLRVELEDWDNNKVWVEHGEFGVSGNSYRLHVKLYDENSTLDDSLRWLNGKRFSTNDTDNDSAPGYSCAQRYEGGWWYGYCTIACLNGKYVHQARAPYRGGIHWEKWKGKRYSMKASSMKIK